jgi:hypothetical protein
MNGSSFVATWNLLLPRGILKVRGGPLHPSWRLGEGVRSQKVETISNILDSRQSIITLLQQSFLPSFFLLFFSFVLLFFFVWKLETSPREGAFYVNILYLQV